MKRLIVVGVPLVNAIAAITVHFSGSRTPLQQRAAKILVLKSEHKLLLLDTGNNVICSYATGETE